MKKITLWACLAGMSCLANAATHSAAKSSGTADALRPAINRTPQSLDDIEPIDESSSPRYRRTTDLFGPQIQFYYDPLSNYDRTTITNINNVDQFGYQGTSGGIWGMQVLLSLITTSNFELATGFNYSFPTTIQGQQGYVGNFEINSQVLSLIGVRALQVGYRVPLGPITLVPYGAIGLDYVKNTLNLTSTTADVITYSKLSAEFTGGARAEFTFGQNPIFALSAGAEFFLPSKISDQLSQSNSVELAGYEPILQPNLDFMTGIGARLTVQGAAYF